MRRIPNDLCAFAFEVCERDEIQSDRVRQGTVTRDGDISTSTPATPGKLADFRQWLLLGTSDVSFDTDIRLQTGL